MFSIISYFTFVKYIFLNNKIIIKYPLLYTKEILIENIIGYVFLFSGLEIELILFMNNNEKIKIKVEGRKMKKYINDFINKISYEIENKNISELIKNGIEFKYGRNRKLFFSNEYVEIAENNIKNKYYYKEDFQDIFFNYFNGNIIMRLKLKNKKILSFNNYMLKGMIGIFKYLEEQIKISPNVV